MGHRDETSDHILLENPGGNPRLQEAERGVSGIADGEPDRAEALSGYRDWRQQSRRGSPVEQMKNKPAVEEDSREPDGNSP